MSRPSGLRQHQISADLWNSPPEPESWKYQINIPVRIQQDAVSADLITLVDSGATGIGYINRSLALKLNLCQTPLKHTIYPTGFNGKQLEGGSISHTTSVTLQHTNHKEQVKLFVTNTSQHNLILG